MIIKKNHDVVLHQINVDDIEKSILYISRDLSNAKTKYWVTKLKVETLMWVLIKLFQYFDDDSFIVITNHIALKFALQIKTKNRRSFKLNEWNMFLFTYFSRMKIIHKIDATHQNANDFFKLFTYDKKSYFIIIMSANETFQNFIRQIFSKNFHFEKIYEKIQQQIKNTKNEKNDVQIFYQTYKLNINIDLLYFVNKSKSNRFCVFVNLQFQFFEFVHDNHVHDDINRFLQKFKRDVYMSKMRKFF